MQKWLVIPDLHWDGREELHPSYLLVKKFAKSFKPDGIVFLGDLFDFAYISSFNKELLKTISGKTFIADYDLGNKELDYWQKLAKKIIIRQGNHDRRVDIVVDKNPILEGMIEVEKNLDYKGRKVEYYKETDMPTQLGNVYFIHGWYTNIHHAKKHVEKMAGNIIYGHTHQVMSHTLILPAFNKEISAWSMGCLTDKNPEWRRGVPTAWAHAFGILYLDDDDNFNLYTVRIIDYKFIWDNHIFKL